MRRRTPTQKNPSLHGRREDQESETALPPAELDAGSRVLRDLAGELPGGDMPRLETEVVHDEVGNDEHGEEQHGPDDVGKREVDLPEQAAPDRPDEHRGAR